MLGRTIGTYRVLAKLGEGGMGTVFVGEHTLLGRRAAIKVLRPEMSARESIVNRFFNEARLVTSISDPGIVQVFDFGVHEGSGSAYIVMELLEGETLQARLKRAKRLEATEALRLGRQIATSLAAAHAKNVVHRDLKPENIFIIADPAVTGGERTKILDFGIAKLLQSDDDPESQHTQTGMLMGTPMYMSPEQCRGAGEVDHRSDIYSVGCLLFRMLAGRPPFIGRGSGEIIASHLKEPPPLLATLVGDVSPDVEHLVQRCLAKDPDQRPQTALELANLLGTVEQGAPYRTPLPGFAPPVSDAAFSPALPTDAPTTMQGASGQAASPPAVKRRLGVIGGIAACLITGGVIALVTELGARNDDDGEGSETVRPMASPGPAATPAPSPAPTPAPSPAPTPTATPEPPPAPEPSATQPPDPSATPQPPPPTATPPREAPPSTASETATPAPTKRAKTATRPAKIKVKATRSRPAPTPSPAAPKPAPPTKPRPGTIERGD